jgi:dTMP kinase
MSLNFFKRKTPLRKGLFITFEGTEGSGKSTQVKRLGELLKKHRVPHVLTREPGGSRLSTHLRRWILNRLDYRLAPQAELHLFLADRAQHVQEILLPALREGKVVLCDRYTDSTLAYQGGGRGFDLKMLSLFNRTATNGLSPDLTLLFDVPVQVGLKRALGRGKGKDRMEQEKIKFHQAVRRVFLKTAKREKKRFIVIDANQDPDTVYQQMIERLIERLPKSTGRSRRG